MKENRGSLYFCFALALLNLGFVFFGIYKLSRPELYNVALSSFLLALNAVAVLLLWVSIALWFRRNRVSKRQEEYISKLETLASGIKELEGRIASPAYAAEKEFLQEELRLMRAERQATIDEYYTKTRV